MPTKSLGKSSELKLHCFCLFDAYNMPTNIYSVNGKMKIIDFLILNPWFENSTTDIAVFQVEYFLLKDSYDNQLAIPKLTIITLLTSGLAIAKTCADLNIVRIHLQAKSL